MMLPELILKPGREKSLLRRHPWIFSGAIASVKGHPEAGESVHVVSSKGEFLAIAAYSPTSQIRARVWTWQQETVDAAFLHSRFEKVWTARTSDPRYAAGHAIRLVHGESDGFPGLILDQYEDVLVMQTLSAGIEFWREPLADLFMQETAAKAIYERADMDVRKLEGLPVHKGWLRGQAKLPLTIAEQGVHFLVDIEEGHKTGFYLDQRANRMAVRALANKKDVLDCFAYSGGFTLNAVEGNASHVTAVESSSAALTWMGRNLELNSIGADRVELVQADVFEYLRSLRDRRSHFDLIILDPPKFAPTRGHAPKAARAYKDINLLAFKLLSPGGFLVTFSCSGGVDADLFQKIVAGAALDAGVQATIQERLFQDWDHPTSLNFPEGTYLKGLICKTATG